MQQENGNGYHLDEEIIRKYLKRGGNYRTTRIQIPEGATLVIMIGTQGSGKTTFCNKYFETERYNIFSIDELFKDIYKEMIEEGVSPDVSVNIAEDLAAVECIEKIKSSLEKKKIAILDANMLDFEGRIEIIRELQPYCDHVIQLTLIRDKEWIIDHLYQRMKDSGISKDEVQDEVEQDMELLDRQLKENLLNVGIERNYILQNQEIDLTKIFII